MATFPYTDFLDDVLPHLAADPSEPVTLAAIKRAAIEFCRESWIWHYLPDPQNVRAGVADYDLEPPSGADIAAVIDVQLANVPLTPKALEWLNVNFPGWRVTPAAVKHYTQLDTDQVILAPLPADNISQGLAMTVALQPSQGATGLPKWIANQYLYAIAEGAIARLMLMPGKPWTDQNTGSAYRARFEAAIANARESALSALGRATTRTTSQH